MRAGIAVLVVVFFGLALYGLAPQIRAHRWQFDPAYLLAAAILMVVRGPVSALGWRAIVARLGYELPLWRSVKITYYAALAGLIPGSMWYAVSRVYMAEQEGVPKKVTVASLALETVLVALAAAIVASLSLLAWHDPPLPLVVAAVATLAIMLLRPNLLLNLMNWGLAKLKREPIAARLSAASMLWLLVPYVAHWLLYGLMSFALVASLFPTLPVGQVPVVAGLFAAAWLGGYLAVFIPQGLVVRELLITGFLTGILGLPAPVAAAAAVLSRAWSLLGVGLWGAISTRL